MLKSKKKKIALAGALWLAKIAAAGMVAYTINNNRKFLMGDLHKDEFGLTDKNIVDGVVETIRTNMKDSDVECEDSKELLDLTIKKTFINHRFKEMANEDLNIDIEEISSLVIKQAEVKIKENNEVMLKKTKDLIANNNEEIFNGTKEMMKTNNKIMLERIESMIEDKINEEVERRVNEAIEAFKDKVIEEEFKDLKNAQEALNNGDNEAIKVLEENADNESVDILDVVNDKLDAQLKFINGELDEAYDRIEHIENALKEIIDNKGTVDIGKIDKEIKSIKDVIEIMTKQSVADNSAFKRINEKVKRHDKGYKLIVDELESLKGNLNKLANGNSNQQLRNLQQEEGKNYAVAKTVKRGRKPKNSNETDDDIKVFTAEQG